MTIKISKDQPVYLQIKAHIRNCVLARQYLPGEKIPTVRELAAQTNVNPNTIQRAMSELEEERLLISHGTLGRFVTEDPTVIDAIKEAAIRETVEDCLSAFQALGLSAKEAALLIARQQEE